MPDVSVMPVCGDVLVSSSHKLANWALLILIFVSYIPQYRRVSWEQSSEGISMSFVWLNAFTNALSLSFILASSYCLEVVRCFLHDDPASSFFNVVHGLSQVWNAVAVLLTSLALAIHVSIYRPRPVSSLPRQSRVRQVILLLISGLGILIAVMAIFGCLLLLLQGPGTMPGWELILVYTLLPLMLVGLVTGVIRGIPQLVHTARLGSQRSLSRIWLAGQVCVLSLLILFVRTQFRVPQYAGYLFDPSWLHTAMQLGLVVTYTTLLGILFYQDGYPRVRSGEAVVDPDERTPLVRD